jgi:hypothetical protein
MRSRRATQMLYSNMAEIDVQWRTLETRSEHFAGSVRMTQNAICQIHTHLAALPRYRITVLLVGSSHITNTALSCPDSLLTSA